MRICLCFDRSRPLVWYKWLADSLTAAGHQVFLCQAEPILRWPQSLDLFITLEKLIHGLSDEQAICTNDSILVGVPSVTEIPKSSHYDVVVNLTGQFDTLPSSNRTLSPMFDCSFSELGAWDALLDGRNITIGIWEGRAAKRLVSTGRVGTARPKVFTKSLGNTISRVADLLLKEVSKEANEPSSNQIHEQDYTTVNHTTVAWRSYAKLITFVTHRISHLMMDLTETRKKWAVGWRNAKSASYGNRNCAPDNFSLLGDDGSRYYADPFPFLCGGRQYIFLEEFPTTLGRGIISYCEIGSDGTSSEPRAVLSESHHLSYPYIFEDNGQIWMLPESAESGKLTLYRAETFPEKWVPECNLLTDVQAYDATLHHNSDGYWLFVTLRTWQSSTWDALSIFHAHSLKGPYIPHPANPLIVDPRVSRSAGRIFRRRKQLYRPAQFGVNTYGEAVTLCRIDTLTQKSFTQLAIGKITARTDDELCGVHTFNFSNGLEVIDVYGELTGDPSVSLHLERADSFLPKHQ